MSRGRARTKQPATRILKTTAAAILAIDIPADSDADEIRVERALTGDPTLPYAKYTRAERDELIRRWPDTGRSWNQLRRLTGWNISRYLREARQGDAA